jgi:hypothetical protein
MLHITLQWTTALPEFRLLRIKSVDIYIMLAEIC